jgi:hypothetical protein
MRSLGLSFVALLLLTLLAVPAPEPASVTAGSAGAYQVRANVSGLGFTDAAGAHLEFGRARLRTESGTLEPSAVAPRRDGEIIRFEEAGWSEQYWLRREALEQVFVIQQPVGQELSIHVPVRSALNPVALDAKRVAFIDDSGQKRLLYKDAIALDAAGHVQDLALSVTGNELAIHVPKEYLANAVYPIVVDPLVGTFITLSPAGGLWRTPGIDLSWNPKDQIYLAVWHENIVFDDPPNNHGHLPHNWLSGSLVRARAIRIDAAGVVMLGDPISTGKPYEGINVGPAATAGTAGPFVAFGPRATYNAQTNEFFVVWSEGKWEVLESPDVDSDGDGMTGGDPDVSVYGDAVTDLNDNISNTNSPNVNEFAYSQDPFPPNTRVVGRPVTVDPATLAATAGTAVEISMGVGGKPGNPNGPPGGVQDPTAVHPALHPDISWDGLQYIVVWQTLEVPTLGRIESLGGNNLEYRHIFYTQSRVRMRRLSPTFSLLGNPVDLANQNERFFLKGDVTQPSNIVDGSVAANLQQELTYESVPTDPAPHLASLILPGADGVLGTMDDQPVGSLIVWNVTSLTFNLSKSRVRGRFLAAGQPSAGIVWDIFSPPVQIVQRATVAAGAAKDAGSPQMTLADSHFLVVFELVENTVKVGRRHEEMVGSLAMRVTATDGQPLGAPVDLVRSITGGNRFYLAPSAMWCPETDQYLITWTETDQMWNPVTHGRAFSARSFSFPEAQLPLFGTVATAYPAAVSASYSPAIDPAQPDTASYHVLFAAQEDDFGANYLRRYKFLPPPNTPGVVAPPGSPSGGGGDSGDSKCGMGQVAPGSGLGSVLALLGAGAGALLLAFCPGLGRTLRPRAKR